MGLETGKLSDEQFWSWAAYGMEVGYYSRTAHDYADERISRKQRGAIDPRLTAR